MERVDRKAQKVMTSLLASLPLAGTRPKLAYLCMLRKALEKICSLTFGKNSWIELWSEHTIRKDTSKSEDTQHEKSLRRLLEIGSQQNGTSWWFY